VSSWTLLAETAGPLSRWVRDSDLVPLMAELGVAVNFSACWPTPARNSVQLLDQLVSNYGMDPNYIVVKNLGRGSDFPSWTAARAMKKVLALGGCVVSLASLHEASMRKIDRQSASFWAATHVTDGPDALGMLERQRVKTWLKTPTPSSTALPWIIAKRPGWQRSTPRPRPPRWHTHRL